MSARTVATLLCAASLAFGFDAAGAPAAHRRAANSVHRQVQRVRPVQENRSAAAVQTSHAQAGVGPLKDLSEAVPARDAARLPTAAAQYRMLKSEIDKNRPALEDAKRRSELLKAEADDLRKRLIGTTRRVQALEDEKGQIDAELARLEPEERAMSATFVQDRAQVARLLAVLERLQSDMPPVIAIKADDALSAARGAMELGGTLPRIYGAAAALSEQLGDLRRKRAELTHRRLQGAQVAAQLANARIELDQLLAIKAQEADEASARYGDLETKLDAAAEQAADLRSLLDKVAALRLRPAGQGIVTVSADNSPNRSLLRRGVLVRPVNGSMMRAAEGAGGERAPGLTFFAAPGAEVVSPGDSEVLFAGSYHKAGKVLILEMRGGYDLVLAGLDAVDVRPGDEVLAGEPVGAMPNAGTGAKLYFELRQNGKGVDPAPLMEVDLRKAKGT